jgi:outer membrane protein OmpA-like peptidoglycan-associated protein
MSFNLIESVKEVLSGDMTNKIAAILGESSSNLHQALLGIIPSIFTGVLLKAETGDIQETLNLATDASRIEIPYNLNSLAGGSGSAKGMDYLKIIFGEKTTVLATAVSSYAGVGQQSASALMSITAPAALGVLGKHILDSNMNASGLRSFLNGQRKKILYALPTSLFLEGILGIDSLSGIAEKFAGTEIPEKKSPSVSRWIWLLLICLAVAGVAWYFLHMEKPVAGPSLPLTDTVKSPKDTVVAGPALESPFTIKLPDATILNVKKGGIEDQLVLFFNDPSAKPSRRYPFNFDQLEFNGGTAVITNESMKQIQNIALILKAYPRAKIKIGGFNEKGGDSVANKQLSESRAVSVALALKAAGAGKNQVISAEGFGSDFARYPVDAPDSLKAKDHRISISIRGK